MLSKSSLLKLQTADERLQLLFKKVSERIDINISCGHRTEEEQEAAFKGGFSKVHFPNSKHNSKPSLAVDCQPLTNGTIEWNNISKFVNLAKIVKEEASKLGIEIVCGADWTKFRDLPHYELKEDK